MNRHRCVISEVRRGFACCHPLFRVRDVIFPRTILIVFARRSPFFSPNGQKTSDARCSAKFAYLLGRTGFDANFC